MRRVMVTMGLIECKESRLGAPSHNGSNILERNDGGWNWAVTYNQGNMVVQNTEKTSCPEQ